MKWIKQIFGIKSEEEQVVINDVRFKNATPTNELVISAEGQKQVSFNDMNEDRLKKMTKTQLEDLAKSELGIELDKRERKADLIKQIIENK